MRVIGLMSGTSLDGVDAALVRLDGDAPEWRVEAFVAHPYPAERRERIHAAIQEGGAPELCRLHTALGEWFAEAALAACAAAGVAADAVDLIGSHGQTVWHEPPAPEWRGSTLQMGCPATIAERTGIPVVSDFRARDTAAGGEGAPLVPWVDRLLFSHPERRRVLQNIGGMANLTRVPRRGEDAPLLAFDTGPGIALVDAAVELATGGERVFDEDGRWAARGQVDEALLEELLAHPFLHRAPPKSTGRETFGRPMVARLAERFTGGGEPRWKDLVATLTELTARSIADAVRRWVLPEGADELIVTGGGARNPELVRRIATALDPLPVRTADALGLDPEAKEAVAFAVLGWAFVRERAGNVPEATGARGPRVLGSFTPGAAARGMRPLGVPGS
ncbi:MAG TPA: anhydro-N-acetylmuramic acid kinase [Longimicrobiales bacterium]|nr:anhydro-N-acetylmuramic acid kinase [Longimicrobiales bacterium]